MYSLDTALIYSSCMCAILCVFKSVHGWFLFRSLSISPFLWNNFVDCYEKRTIFPRASSSVMKLSFAHHKNDFYYWLLNFLYWHSSYCCLLKLLLDQKRVTKIDASFVSTYDYCAASWLIVIFWCVFVKLIHHCQS